MPAGAWKKTTRKTAPAESKRLETPAAGAPPPAPPARRWRRHALWIAVLWALALAAYANSFRTGLPLDNTFIILRDARIQAATQENVNLILTRDYWYKTSTSGLYRPLTTLSYLFNYSVLGNRDRPAGYHWVNFGLHAVNIALVYALGLLLLGEIPLAFAMAAIWAVHPALTESITNVVGRADLLMGFGVLAGLLCHVRAAAASGWRKAAWLLALAFAAAVGLFSKESAVLIVAAMAIYDVTFWGARPWRARIAGYVVLVAPFLLFFTMRARVLAAGFASVVPFTDNPLVAAGFWTARLTAVKVIGKYLWLMVWPHRLSCDYSYNQVPLVSWRLDSLEDWKAWAALAVCAGAAAAAVFCYRRSKPAFFFVAFLFAAFVPTSNLLVIIGTIMAERFLYLPAIGFAGLVVMAGHAAVRRMSLRWPGAPTGALVALVLVCTALAGRTFARNYDWYDERSLWTSALKAAPQSYKVHSALSVALTDSKPEAARMIREAERSLEILTPVPDDLNVSNPYGNAGLGYRIVGDRLAPSPASTEWYRKSLTVLLQGQRISNAIMERNRQLNLKRGKAVTLSGWYVLYLELGRVYMRLGEYQNALDAIQKGRVLRQSPELSAQLADVYKAMGDQEHVAISLMEGITIDPDEKLFASQLASVYQELDPKGCAVVKTGGTISLNPDCPLVRSHICTAAANVVRLYLKAGEPREAAKLQGGAAHAFGCAGF